MPILDYEKPPPYRTAWASSLAWLVAAALCAGFLWLCIQLSDGQSNTWDKRGAGRIAFLICITAACFVCLIKAIRPLVGR
jgi:hypothetical protein